MVLLFGFASASALLPSPEKAGLKGLEEDIDISRSASWKESRGNSIHWPKVPIIIRLTKVTYLICNSLP